MSESIPKISLIGGEKVDIIGVAKVIGALQDSLRVNAETTKQLSDEQYSIVASLDVIFLELTDYLSVEDKNGIIQNTYDSSKNGAANDLNSLKTIRDYFNKRIESCEKYIKENGMYIGGKKQS